MAPAASAQDRAIAAGAARLGLIGRRRGRRPRRRRCLTVGPRHGLARGARRRGRTRPAALAGTRRRRRGGRAARPAQRSRWSVGSRRPCPASRLAWPCAPAAGGRPCLPAAADRDRQSADRASADHRAVMTPPAPPPPPWRAEPDAPTGRPRRPRRRRGSTASGAQPGGLQSPLAVSTVVSRRVAPWGEPGPAGVAVGHQHLAPGAAVGADLEPQVVVADQAQFSARPPQPLWNSRDRTSSGACSCRTGAGRRCCRSRFPARSTAPCWPARRRRWRRPVSIFTPRRVICWISSEAERQGRPGAAAPDQDLLAVQHHRQQAVERGDPGPAAAFMAHQTARRVARPMGRLLRM